MAIEIDFTKTPLIPAIAQDASSGQVLMVAYMNRESLQRTLETGQAWFWSRSRNELWHKGATSGNVLSVRSVVADCDADTLLLLVDPAGPTCHTSAVSCFYHAVSSEGGQPVLREAPEASVAVTRPVEELFGVIESRKVQQPEDSYVAKLLSQGVNRVAKKVTEEAGETVIAAVGESDQRLIEEVADLWFHSLILLSARGLTPADIWRELESRRK